MSTLFEQVVKFVNWNSILRASTYGSAESRPTYAECQAEQVITSWTAYGVSGVIVYKPIFRWDRRRCKLCCVRVVLGVVSLGGYSIFRTIYN